MVKTGTTVEENDRRLLSQGRTVGHQAGALDVKEESHSVDEHLHPITSGAFNRRTVADTPMSVLLTGVQNRSRRHASACLRSAATANSDHSPDTPFNAWRPRSAKRMPDPATRSRTVLDTRTSPEPA